LPFDVQLDLVHSMKGLENAHITRPGYAIEYDYFDPMDLRYSLETKFVEGLFFAGQINGTTGYEEAGAQGLLAGLNAALRSQEKEAWTPRRDEAYLGVLVDDLISMGTREPYRMFTSRAEYRLILREDNADTRLTEKGRELGLINDDLWERYSEKKDDIGKETQRMKSTWVQPGSAIAEKLNVHIERPLTREYSLMELMRRPELDFDKIAQATGESSVTDIVAEQVEIAAKYEGYISRQLDDIEKLKRNESTKLPADMDYDSVKGLSNEVKQKLEDHRPETLGQASRLQGITPSAVSLLLVALKKHRATRKPDESNHA